MEKTVTRQIVTDFATPVVRSQQHRELPLFSRRRRRRIGISV